MGIDAKRIVIVGAGGQGSIVADILEVCGAPAIGFVDDTPSLERQVVHGLRVLGGISSLRAIDHDAVVVAIGDNGRRRALTETLVAQGERLVSAIHPFSSISSSATIGEGAMISAGAIVLPNVTIGRGVLLNTKASVDHDSQLGAFVHVSAGATVGANVRIGQESMMALGASVASGMTIGDRTVIGAGAMVVRDIPSDVVAWGVPARVMQSRSRTGAP